MNIKESNKLIADFIKFGVKPTHHAVWVGSSLIPVIDKIYEDNDYDYHYFHYNGSLVHEGKIEITTSIIDTYEEVIDFIKYKNEKNRN